MGKIILLIKSLIILSTYITGYAGWGIPLWVESGHPVHYVRCHQVPRPEEHM